MSGETHEPNIESYAIGSADSLRVDYIGGTHTVQFDLKQVRENDFIRYYVEGLGHGRYFDTSPVPSGKFWGEHLIDDLQERTEEEIRAVIIPRYLERYGDFDDYEVLYD